jgi:hypothetical protein
MADQIIVRQPIKLKINTRQPVKIKVTGSTRVNTATQMAINKANSNAVALAVALG